PRVSTPFPTRRSSDLFGLAEVLRAALEPVSSDIRAAFVYGSIAKGQDTAMSDIDLMVVSDRLTYADLFAALEDAARRLGRKVSRSEEHTSELQSPDHL